MPPTIPTRISPTTKPSPAYEAEGGYATLKDLRANGDWEAVQAKVKEAGLRGLGGAGFPSGTKWGFVRANEGPRYIAVNGDEGEPGTFKDRYYLERTPHVFLEGMLMAAWAVEAEKAFIYMRDEYPAVLHILAAEIKALEDAGIVEPGYIDLRRGAGAYICGEESAMIESIEGKRRRAAPPSAVCGAGRHLWTPDPGSQCRNALLGVQDQPRRAGMP